MELVADVISSVIAFRRPLLIGVAGGVVFSLASLLLRPILRRQAAHTEVKRLLFAAKDCVATYVLAGLAAGSWWAAIGVLIPLRAPRHDQAAALLGCLLFMLGFLAMLLISRRAERRLATQLIELQATHRRDDVLGIAT